MIRYGLKPLLLLVVVLLSGCAVEPTTYSELRDVDGSGMVEYDVHLSSLGDTGLRLGMVWYGEKMRVTMRPSSATSSELSSYSTGSFGNQTCELSGVSEGKRYFDCDDPGENRAKGFYEVLQNILSSNASAMKETGEGMIAGRRCTEFRADAKHLVMNTSEYNGRPGRLTVCLDDSTGRPLHVAVEEKAEPVGDRPGAWETLIAVNASSYEESVTSDDADPLVPFTVTYGYASPNNSVFHAAVEATVGFEGELRAGSLGDGPVNVGFKPGERRVVELPVTNTSQASRFDSDETWSDPLVSSVNIPVCLDGVCVYADDAEECITIEPKHCRGLAACRPEGGVCLPRPAYCVIADSDECEGLVSGAGQRCGGTPKGCGPIYGQRGRSAEDNAAFDFAENPVVGEPVTFTASGAESKVDASYDWFIGEEGVGSGESMTYTFDSQGTYIVGLEENGSSWSTRPVTLTDK